MSKYFDGFIRQQQDLGIDVSPELIQVNAELHRKDRARAFYSTRGLLCRLGLHKRIIDAFGGSYPLTCSKCWRHEL